MNVAVHSLTSSLLLGVCTDIDGQSYPCTIYSFVLYTHLLHTATVIIILLERTKKQNQPPRSEHLKLLKGAFLITMCLQFFSKPPAADRVYVGQGGVECPVRWGSSALGGHFRYTVWLDT